MARTRMVKPGLFGDEKVAKVSIPARYIFIGLLTEADDKGVLHNNEAKIAGNLFPLEKVPPRKVRTWLDELERVGLIALFVAKDTPCIYIPGFPRHQKVSHPTPSPLPNPPADLANGSGEVPSQLGVGEGDGAGGGVESVAPTPSPRAKDPLFEALCEATGIDWHELTEDGRGSVNRALKQLRDVGATPNEIFRRASNYLTWFDKITPPALAKHWAQCANPAQPTSPRPRPDPVMQRARRAADLRRQEEADDAREPDRGAHHALGS